MTSVGLGVMVFPSTKLNPGSWVSVTGVAPLPKKSGVGVSSRMRCDQRPYMLCLSLCAQSIRASM